MITQHEHGQLSGAFARHFQQRFFIDQRFYEDLMIAVSEHDRCWIGLDDTPIWNDAASVPYTFIDYPLLPKLAFYRFGIDEIEQMSPYAALLCSLHFASFLDLQTSVPQAFVDFCNDEQRRQERIRSQMPPMDEDTIYAHFRLLQLCDDLSLYVCLNEPGAAKNDEHPWFRDGFDKARGFAGGEHQQPMARWVSPNEIAVAPSIFEHSFSSTFQLKRVPKPLVHQLGIAQAYQETDWTVQEVVIING